MAMNPINIPEIRGLKEYAGMIIFDDQLGLFVALAMVKGSVIATAMAPSMVTARTFIYEQVGLHTEAREFHGELVR